jgi:hypothetical protein
VVYEAGREVEKGGHRVILEETPGRVFPEERTMAATASIDAIEWLRKQIEEAAPDPQKTMLTEMVSLLMSAEVDAVCWAGYGERGGERVNSRNGYRGRPWDTQVGTIDLQNPKLRHSSYFPGWLLEPRRRAEKALTAVVAEAYLLGVSARKVEDPDARRMLADLKERLVRFGLALHEEKTRLIEFGRLPALRREKRGERRPETFAFLVTRRASHGGRSRIWRRRTRARGGDGQLECAW